jgi:hypothetical protein
LQHEKNNSCGPVFLIGVCCNEQKPAEEKTETLLWKLLRRQLNLRMQNILTSAKKGIAALSSGDVDTW